MRTGTPSARPFSKELKDLSVRVMYCKFPELHQAVKCQESCENKKAKALRSVKEAKDKGTDFQRSGQRAEDSDKTPSEVGSLGNPPEKAHRLLWQTYRAKMWSRPILSNERTVKSEAARVAFGLRIMCQQSMLEVMSPEDEDDFLTRKEVLKTSGTFNIGLMMRNLLTYLPTYQPTYLHIPSLQTLPYTW